MTLVITMTYIKRPIKVARETPCKRRDKNGSVIRTKSNQSSLFSQKVVRHLESRVFLFGPSTCRYPIGTYKEFSWSKTVISRITSM